MKKLTNKKIQEAAKELGVQPAWIKAFIKKETPNPNGGGFMADGVRPIILFERHIFHKHTKGKYSKMYPDISNPRAGGYGRYVEQHDRLHKAAKLDREAALQSASWGLFQILGENWKSLKYKTLQEFINAMYRSENDQLEAFIRFIKVNRIDKYMRENNFAEVARRYNGPNYKINNYDKDLKKYFLSFGGKLTS